MLRRLADLKHRIWAELPKGQRGPLSSMRLIGPLRGEGITMQIMKEV